MKLIPLDAVLAILDKLIDELILLRGRGLTMYEIERIAAFEDAKTAINHLKKVKEVDLEKAIDDYIYTHDGRKRLALELDWKCCNLTLKGGDEIIKFAKYFFELGVNASNPLTWEDVRLLDILCCGVDVHCDLEEKEHYDEVLKRFKAQKGEKV